MMRTPCQFLCTDPHAHIEPAAFVAHLLAHQGVDKPTLGLRRTVLLPLIPALERRLLRRLGSSVPSAPKLQHRPLYHPKEVPFSLVASPMGAPMAAMLLEQLIVLGARRFLYLGFCGALQPGMHIGDLFIPEKAVREEGTSYHYLPPDTIPTASARCNAILQAAAGGTRVPVHQGTIWTTDAPYRETPTKIRRLQAAGVCAVDMEMAALFAVATYRQCEIAALLVVSDECYHTTWQPGFGQPRLRQACQQAVELGLAAATAIATMAEEVNTP